MWRCDISDRPCPTGFGWGTVPNHTIIDWEKGWWPLLQVPSYGQPLCQQQQVRTISSVTQQPLQIVRYCRVSHLSKGSSGRKQKCTHFQTPFSGTVFDALSHGVIHFVRSVSFKNLEIKVFWLAVEEFQPTKKRFLKLTLWTKCQVKEH